MKTLLDETVEEREEARKRGHRKRADLHPSQKAQERYPLEKYPCERCANEDEGLPHLVDNGSEFYWHHQHQRPGSSARSGCPRFGVSGFAGGRPRPGTAASLWMGRCQDFRLRSEAEYLRALEAVEEKGADDAWDREGLGRKP